MSTTPDATRPLALETLAVGVGLLAGPANVIMQLSRPGVGYGVLESTVESGQVTRHPVKRARTTFTYLAVALLGSDDERRAYRRAVDRVHAQVRSTPHSPVHYSAFDQDLQLWVAACLYVGFEDTVRLFGPSIEPAQRERLYRDAAVLGTTLQVPPERWPADLAAFRRYWSDGLARARLDEPVREYLTDLVMLRHLPRPAGALFGRASRFVTTGFLPPPLREAMRLPWDDRRQRRFEAVMADLGAVVRRAPRAVRVFPLNLCLMDLRRRLRTGRPLV